MLDKWHEIVKSRNPNLLDDLLDPSVVLHSPVIHRDIVGEKMVKFYLSAALQTFVNDTFTYVNEFKKENGVVLEFTTEIEGIHVNGVDMITWNENGKIVDFKVMVRPIKALNLINDNMTALLELMQAKAKS